MSCLSNYSIVELECAIVNCNNPSPANRASVVLGLAFACVLAEAFEGARGLRPSVLKHV